MFTITYGCFACDVRGSWIMISHTWQSYHTPPFPSGAHSIVFMHPPGYVTPELLHRGLIPGIWTQLVTKSYPSSTIHNVMRYHLYMISYRACGIHQMKHELFLFSGTPWLVLVLTYFAPDSTPTQAFVLIRLTCVYIGIYVHSNNNVNVCAYTYIMNFCHLDRLQPSIPLITS